MKGRPSPAIPEPASPTSRARLVPAGELALSRQDLEPKRSAPASFRAVNGAIDSEEHLWYYRNYARLAPGVAG